eukprot:427523_1
MYALFFVIISLCTSQWISPDHVLPRASHEMAVGAYNKTVFLLGGSNPNPNQLVEYKIDSNVFIDHGASALSNSLSCSSQCSTQMDNKLYIITWYSAQSLSIYNMATNTFTPDWAAPFPIEVNHYACLTSSFPYLFVVGGYRNFGASPIDYHYMDTIQILHVETKQWTDGPVMLTKRGRFSCAMYQDELYAIGGVYGDSAGEYLSSIEKINIQSKSSEYIGNLIGPAESTRAVIYNDLIWVIGGLYRTSDSIMIRDTVHIIDPITANVSLSSERLIYPVDGVAAIVVNNVIYAFGGRHSDVNTLIYLDTWMEYESPSDEMTCDDNIFPATELAPTNEYDEVDNYHDPNEMNMCLFSASNVGYDTKLSNNFAVNEFTCKDGSDGFRLSPALIECLQSVRNTVNGAITINSGYRTVNHNAKVKGKPTSMHLSGTAADITTTAVSIFPDFAEIIICNCKTLFEEKGYDIGLGLANTYIHVDMRKVAGSWTYDSVALSDEKWKDFIQNTSTSCTDPITTDVVSTKAISTDADATESPSTDSPTAISTVNRNHVNTFTKCDLVWTMVGFLLLISV